MTTTGNETTLPGRSVLRVNDDLLRSIERAFGLSIDNEILLRVESSDLSIDNEILLRVQHRKTVGIG